jgi:hypothetical protein
MMGNVEWFNYLYIFFWWGDVSYLRLSGRLVMRKATSLTYMTFRYNLCPQIWGACDFDAISVDCCNSGKCSVSWSVWFLGWDQSYLVSQIFVTLTCNNNNTRIPTLIEIISQGKSWGDSWVYSFPPVSPSSICTSFFFFFTSLYVQSVLFWLHIIIPSFPRSFSVQYFFLLYCRICFNILSSVIWFEWFIQFCLYSSILVCTECIFSFFFPNVFSLNMVESNAAFNPSWVSHLYWLYFVSRFKCLWVTLM